MGEKIAVHTQVALERTLLLEMLESSERVLEGMSNLVDGLRTIATTETATADEPLVDEPVEPRVWDTTDEALENYDADQLVALRSEHRADKHDVADCRVCKVLLRRLGAL